jgi:membrane protein YqaA with SNARE-associated domain
MYYALVFLGSLLVDLLPFMGPPAWTVMVYMQIKFGLNIWLVLVVGVLGSTVGRYVLSLYIPFISHKYINTQKNEDIEFVGKHLENNSWRVRLFVLLYSLLPLPTTPLFTAAGMAKVRILNIIPSFLIGKFVSDMVMVLSGDYAARNAIAIATGYLSWKSITGALSGIVIIVLFLGIDWRLLLQHKRFKLNFNIFK